MIRRPLRKKSFKYVDAVLCSDLHIRADVPECRTDDFLQAQEKKLKFIFDLCREYDCPLYIGGDIGHRSQWPNWLLEKFISIASGIQVYACLGQHDLPSHSTDLISKSAVGVLSAAGIIDISEDYCEIRIFHYGQKIKNSGPHAFPYIALSHQLIIQDKEDWPGQEAVKGISLLKKHPVYKLILTGDNHKPFVIRYDGRLLVNPGSMMRTTADQIDHKPRVYLWNQEQNDVIPIYLPIEEDVIDRSHIDIKKHNDDIAKRIEAFIEKMKSNDDFDISFEDNLKVFFRKNRVRKAVKEKIEEMING